MDAVVGDEHVAVIFGNRSARGRARSDEVTQCTLQVCVGGYGVTHPQFRKPYRT